MGLTGSLNDLQSKVMFAMDKLGSNTRKGVDNVWKSCKVIPNSVTAFAMTCSLIYKTL